MNRGLTLVELMTAIIIVGILAAITIPQFTSATARARASEVPLNLNKIRSAQEAHKVETKRYKDSCSWGIDAGGSPYDAANQPNGKDLGVTITASKFFNYNSGTTAEGYEGTANLYRKIGAAPVGMMVKLNQSDSAYVSGGGSDGEMAMMLYLRTFLTN